MYVTNMDNFGHLKETDSYSTNRKYNDMYEIFNNRLVSPFVEFNVSFVNVISLVERRLRVTRF